MTLSERSSSARSYLYNHQMYVHANGISFYDIAQIGQINHFIPRMPMCEVLQVRPSSRQDQSLMLRH